MKRLTALSFITAAVILARTLQILTFEPPAAETKAKRLFELNFSEFPTLTAKRGNIREPVAFSVPMVKVTYPNVDSESAYNCLKRKLASLYAAHGLNYSPSMRRGNEADFLVPADVESIDDFKKFAKNCGLNPAAFIGLSRNIPRPSVYLRAYAYPEELGSILGYYKFSGEGLEGFGVEKTAVKLQSQTRSLDLTIDLNVQEAVFQTVKDLYQSVKKNPHINTFSDEYPTVVMGGVVDVYNGEVLALASYPTFNSFWLAPSYFPGKKTVKTPHETAPFLFRRFEPGSVFKPLFLNFGLEYAETHPGSDGLKAGEKFPTKFKKGRVKVRNFEDPKEEEMNVEEGLINSVNGVFAWASEKLSPEGWRELMRYYRLSEGCAIAPVEEVARSNVPLSSAEHTRIFWSFGQGLELTMCHLLRAYLILFKTRDIPSTDVELSLLPTDRRFSDSSVRKTYMYKLMRRAVREGTGKKLSPLEREGVGISAKTGTAQQAVKGETIPYSTGRENLSVIAITDFGTKGKRYYIVALTVLSVKPAGERLSAGKVVAPFVRKLIERVRQNAPERDLREN